MYGVANWASQNLFGNNQFQDGHLIGERVYCPTFSGEQKLSLLPTTQKILSIYLFIKRHKCVEV